MLVLDVMTFFQNIPALGGFALVLGLVAIGLAFREEPPRRVSVPVLIFGVMLLVLGFLPLWSGAAGLNPVSIFLVGLGVLLGALPGHSLTLRVMAAVGVLTGAICFLAPDASLGVWLAGAAGIGLGSILAGSSVSGGVAAVMVALLGACNTSGVAQLGGVHPAPGAMIAVGLLLTLALVQGLGGAMKDAKLVVLVAGGAVVFVGLAMLISSRVFLLGEVGLMAVLGAAMGGALAWAISPEDEPRPIPILLAAILTIAVGTAAFAEARGLGMALSALGAVVVASLAANPRAVAVASPLVILALYRAFGVAFPDAARALDIGQHYGLIGVLGGILAAALLAEFAEDHPLLPRVLAVVSAVLACAFVPMLLGAKGAVGVLVGLGFAPVLAVLFPKVRHAYAGAMLLAGSLTLAYPMLRDRMDLTRAEKLPLLAGVGVVVLLTAVAAAWLARPTNDTPEESA